MTNAKCSFLLLVAAGALFCFGLLFTEVDSAKRWGVVIVSLLGVPPSFFWGAFSFMKEKDKTSKAISTLTLTVSGAIMIVGVFKLF